MVGNLCFSRIGTLSLYAQGQCFHHVNGFSLESVFSFPTIGFHAKKYLFWTPEAHFGGQVGGLGCTLGQFGEAVQSFGTSRRDQWHGTWVLRGFWSRGVGETAENGQPKGRRLGGGGGSQTPSGRCGPLSD